MRGSGLQFNINTEEILNLFGKTFLFRSPFSSLLWTEKDKVSIKQIHMALKTINYDWKCLSQVEHLLWSIIVVVYLVLYQIWVPTTIIFYEGLSDTRFRLDSPSSNPVLKKITLFQYTFVLLSIVQLKLLKLVVIDRNSISCLVCSRFYLAKKNKAKIETLAILLSIIKIFSFKNRYTDVSNLYIER